MKSKEMLMLRGRLHLLSGSASALEKNFLSPVQNLSKDLSLVSRNQLESN